MRKYVVAFAALCTFYALANQVIDDALQSVITNGCLSDRRTADQIDEWGVPGELFSEARFTNLVSVMRANVATCPPSYVYGLTNLVRRAVFVAALTECGRSVYRDSVVRWFGQRPMTQPIDIEVLDSFLFPVGTSMEDYIDMHFDVPGVSNVLSNAKEIYQARSNTVIVAALDAVLSGEIRASKTRDLDAGLIDRILDGSDE